MSGTLVVAAVGVPFLAAAAVLAAGDRPKRRQALTVGATLATLAAVVGVTPTVLDGGRPGVAVGTLAGDAPFALAADPMGTTFALVAAVLWVLANVYSVGYMEGAGEGGRTRFFAAFAASVGAALGVAFAANLLTLFVFYEVLTVATYPLVTHHADAEARRSGRKYLAYTLGGGVAVLAGTLLVAVEAGTLAFTPGGVGGLGSGPEATVALALLVVGFSVKAAVMPLHGWLPDAMVAPTPVSGLLHAVAVVKSGAFGVGRVLLFVFGADAVHSLGAATPIAAAAGATMVLAGLLALRQDKLKRGLAYSTVSQLSYIVLGFALLTPAAVAGALLHLVAHAFMKITLFFVAGALYVELDVEYVSELGGIWRRMPATTTAFAVASAGLVGMPGVAGFVSKTRLLVGAFAAEAPLAAVALLAAGLLKLLFFWPIVLRAATGDDAVAGFQPVAAADDDHVVAHDGGQEDESRGGSFESRSPLREADPRLVVPLVLTVLVAVVVGLVPDATPFLDLAETTAEAVVADG